MILFFTIARAIRAAYKAVRAAVGIMLVAHGTYQWVKARQRQRALPN